MVVRQPQFTHQHPARITQLDVTDVARADRVEVLLRHASGPPFRSVSGSIVRGTRLPQRLATVPGSPAGRFSTVISSRNPRKESRAKFRRMKKRDSEGGRGANLSDVVSAVEKVVLADMNRIDRFSDQATLLECTARLLQERYGLKTDTAGANEYDSDYSNSSEATAVDLSHANLGHNMRKILRERQRRRVINHHLSVLRKLLKVDQRDDKKAVLHAVIEFLVEQRCKRENAGDTADSSFSAAAAAAQKPTSSSDQHNKRTRRENVRNVGLGQGE